MNNSTDSLNTSNSSRRQWLGKATLAAGAALIGSNVKANPSPDHHGYRDNPGNPNTSLGTRIYNICDFGAKGDGKTLNTKAIQAAIVDLRDGDVLLIAGKGHETGQIVGERTLPFSDHDAVADALKVKVA